MARDDLNVLSAFLVVAEERSFTRAAGLAFTTVEHAGEQLASRKLRRVLEDWCPPFPGFYLYYPGRRQLPAALSALIETLRL